MQTAKEVLDYCQENNVPEEVLAKAVSDEMSKRKEIVTEEQYEATKETVS